MDTTTLQFFDGTEVRAAWDDKSSKWFYCVVDIVDCLAGSDNPQTYWRKLKQRLKESQTVTNCHAFKFLAGDGKMRAFDCLCQDDIYNLAKSIPSKKAAEYLRWFTFAAGDIDSKSKERAYALWESSFIRNIEVGTFKGLQQIHTYVFGGLFNGGEYGYAGQIRDENIAKKGFQFMYATELPYILSKIDKMPERTFDEIIDKYIEMNIAHPFREGNGRSTRLWLDLIFKKNIKKCVDWRKISKKDYLNAMVASTSDGTKLKAVLKATLTDKIGDREVFMKGIDQSYEYEKSDTKITQANTKK